MKGAVGTMYVSRPLVPCVHPDFSHSGQFHPVKANLKISDRVWALIKSIT